MNSLKQTIATLGLSSLLAFAPVLNLTDSVSGQAVYAMTEAQAFERLSSIPVFALTDDKGAPLLAQIPQQANRPQSEVKQLMVFFLSPEDAQAALDQVRRSNPNVGNKARISVTSFNEAYKVIKANKDKTLGFEFVPSRASLESARALVKAQGRNENDVPPLPVFFAVSGTGNQQGLLMIEAEGRQTVPFFFDQRDLQALLDRARQQQPNIARDARIQVTSLYQVIDSMITKDNKPNPEAAKFQFVPARTAFEYVMRNNPNPGRPASPAPATPNQRPAATPSPAPSPAR